ncbi:hypothetical protein [Sphingomonas sanxanigenens]|uniref:Uncharacterized protein n=1 Tax=Sphingomonas sanxanigenens DSM 19645 = NX02 TaxID=1123269 RepID=W0ADY4_9SPHN|nr:hypothetical protein [Sphingomonas sanxanigenens]AHE54757.1 hypothetical protein NX02_15370 [Sphingomonas sanxanigenens DSM 19645 = NX02]
MRTRLLAGLLALLAGAAAPAMAKSPQPPSPAEAMRALCGVPDADAEGCTIEGQNISAWRTVEYAVDGAPGFTLLATVSEDADADSPHLSAPGDTLGLAQVSYRFRDARWQQTSRQINFGSIAVSGAAGNPPIVGEGRLFVQQALSNGMLIGLPIRRFEPGGISITGFSMFRLAVADASGWTYAGDIDTGTDNGADCDGGGAERPCYASSGTLRQLQVRTAGLPSWPDFEVAVSGTIVGDDGKVRPVTAEDATLWRFSEKAGAYVGVTRRCERKKTC